MVELAVKPQPPMSAEIPPDRHDHGDTDQRVPKHAELIEHRERQQIDRQAGDRFKQQQPQRQAGQRMAPLGGGIDTAGGTVDDRQRRFTSSVPGPNCCLIGISGHDSCSHQKRTNSNPFTVAARRIAVICQRQAQMIDGASATVDHGSPPVPRIGVLVRRVAEIMNPPPSDP